MRVLIICFLVFSLLFAVFAVAIVIGEIKKDSYNYKNNIEKKKINEEEVNE